MTAKKNRRDPGEIITGNLYDKKNSVNPVEKFLYSRFEQAVRNAVKDLPIRSAIEIGCGEGNVIPLLKDIHPKAAYTAVDIDSDLLRMAEGQGADKTILVSPECTHYPVQDQSFDIVLLIEVLEHLDSPESVLREAARISAGSVLATVPYEPWWRMLNMLRFKYLRDFGNTPGHINHFSIHSLKCLLEKYFTIEKVYSVFPWIFIEAGNGTS